MNEQLYLIDSHAHLTFPDYGTDLEEVLERARQSGVKKIINIGTSLEDSEEIIHLANKTPNVWATVGLPPNDNPETEVENTDWDKFTELAQTEKVVGIGECGLDYSRLDGLEPSKKGREIDRQRRLFIKQLEIATNLGLPLSIHIRDAYNDLMEIVKEFPKPMRAVFHCFSGTKEYLDFLLGSGHNFFFSFAGNITFKKADSLRDLASQIPQEKLMVETDCPFLTPEPQRGNRNEPANVTITAQKLAEVKGVTIEKLIEITTQNTERLFKI